MLDLRHRSCLSFGENRPVKVTVEWGHGNHVPADGDPPYMTSLGEDEDDRPFTVYVAGDHQSESAWRHTIPAPTVRAAARHFLLTGQLDPEIRWTEI
jgi:hypothetical protein